MSDLIKQNKEIKQHTYSIEVVSLGLTLLWKSQWKWIHHCCCWKKLEGFKLHQHTEFSFLHSQQLHFSTFPETQTNIMTIPNAIICKLQLPFFSCSQQSELLVCLGVAFQFFWGLDCSVLVLMKYSLLFPVLLKKEIKQTTNWNAYNIGVVIWKRVNYFQMIIKKVKKCLELCQTKGSVRNSILRPCKTEHTTSSYEIINQSIESINHMNARNSNESEWNETKK